MTAASFPRVQLTDPSGSFVPDLESLRGLAAFSVVLAHALALFNIDGSGFLWTIPFFEQTSTQKLFMFATAIFNPDFSVLLFFVLSGYVLTLSLERGAEKDGPWVISYYIRRALRLLPPMWFSIAVCALVYNAVHLSDSRITEFFHKMTSVPTISDIVKNVLLINFNVNSVTWTMYVEVLGSIILPITWVASRRDIRSSILVLALMVLTAALLRHYDSRFVVCFQVGSLIALYPIRRFGWNAALAAIGCSIILVMATRLFVHYWAFAILAYCLASALVIAGIAAGALQFVKKMLQSRPLRVLGRVSYSLYLLHIPVFACVLSIFEQAHILASRTLWRQLVEAIGGVSVSIVIAYLAYEFVEVPSMRWGRRLAVGMPISGAIHNDRQKNG